MKFHRMMWNQWSLYVLQGKAVWRSGRSSANMLRTSQENNIWNENPYKSNFDFCDFTKTLFLPLPFIWFLRSCRFLPDFSLFWNRSKYKLYTVMKIFLYPQVPIYCPGVHTPRVAFRLLVQIQSLPLRVQTLKSSKHQICIEHQNLHL